MKVQAVSLFKKFAKTEDKKTPPVVFKGLKFKAVKKGIIAIFIAFVAIGSCYADELQANQATTLENNKAVISVQKQPNDEKSKQKQNVKNNWFCVVIQVNGKAPFDRTDNQK